MEDSKDQQESRKLYVTDPVLIKDGITSFMSYSLCGSLVPQQIPRRYRDFDSLRNKLTERWPGVYIPNIPHKKAVGANEKEFVENRKEMLNRFCSKLSEIPYLINSEEIRVFTENVRDVPKSISTIPPHSYEELYSKYSTTFRDYNDDFNIAQSKIIQAQFLQILKSSCPRIRTFRELIKQSKEHYNETIENECGIINMFSLYEKECMGIFNDESKLIFFNLSNNDLSDKITNFQSDNVNPYDKLYDDISDDLLNTEAMIETIMSLRKLQESYDMIVQKCSTLEQNLNEMKTGKANIKALLSLKKKEENIQVMNEEKEKLENDKGFLDKIIKIALFNMEKEIEKFQVKSINDYKRELSELESTFTKNNSLLDSIWSRVLEDKNIKPISD